MTFTEFAAKHGITLKSERITTKQSGFRYLVTLNYAGKAHVTKFHKGSLCVGVPVRVRCYDSVTNSDFFGVTWRELNWKELKEYDRCKKNKIPLYGSIRHTEPIPPQIGELLYCLASDCSGFQNNTLWPDWAAEYGYNVDSIKDKKIFKKCRKSHAKLRKLFGDAIFNEMMECSEE